MNPNTSTPLIRQGWLRAVLFMLVFLVCALPAGSIAGALMTTPQKDAQAVNPTFIILSLFITSVIAILLAILFRKIIDRKTVMSLGFNWRGYEQEAYTGLSMGPALLGLGTLLLMAINKLDWTDASFHASDFFIALVLMAMIALAEEIVFRGYILKNLMRSVNKWMALGISSVLFALAHWGNPGMTSVAAVNLLLGGLLLGINYIYTRNLWFAIAFHFSWNFFQGPVLGYEVSGLPLHNVLQPDLKGSWWITGGSFGFEGSFITTCLFIAALLLLYTTYEARSRKSEAGTMK